MHFDFCYLYRCIYIYMLFQFCSGDVTISEIPEAFLRIPFSADGFDFFAKFCFIARNLYGNNCVQRKFFRWRFPGSAFDYQFDRFYALPCRGIIPESHTNKVITVFTGKAFCTALTGFKNEASFHTMSRCGIFLVTIRKH